MIGGFVADSSVGVAWAVWSHLELATRRALPLASRDADLNQAANRCGVKLLLA